MKIIYSKLENNVFSDVLVKKGQNLITEKDFETLSFDNAFNNAFLKGFIQIQEPVEVQEEIIEEIQEPEEILDQAENTIDFEKISYRELKIYVAKNNIKAKSNKKDDLIEAIKESL